MRNLNIWDVNVKELSINFEGKHGICYGHDDSNAGELYVCSEKLLLQCFGEDGGEKWSKDLSDIASPDNKPINLAYMTLTNTVCVGLENGELITIGENGSTSDLVGVCENGILAMEWSADQELLVIVTKDLNTILMSCTFDPMHEVKLLSQEFGEKQFITVGWGKKETQFHGSEGKAARVTTEISADPNVGSDNTIKITWRGDGNLFAVGFTMDGIRRFKVFDREGHLQYTSEKQLGLESNVCWRPSGNVIATTQRLTDKYEVAFFEKNGLKHGGFDIPVNSTTVVEDIQWSSDSEIIVLQCKDLESKIQKLLFFTTGNYHWYLKQALFFDAGQQISKILWDNDFEVQNNKKLHVVLCNGTYVTYTWIWNVDHSKGTDEADDAVVAVIDGNKLRLTGFRQTAVPPPMAALELETDSFINSVHFAPNHKGQNIDSNSFFIITVENKLVLYEQTSKFPLEYKMVKARSLNKYDFPLQYYNWHWLNSDVIICTVAGKDMDYKVIEYKLDPKQEIMEKICEETIPGAILRVESNPLSPTSAFLQLNNGDLLEYGTGGKIEPQEVSFTHVCPKFNVCLIEDSIHFIGLSHKGNFFINGAMIMNNVSSFFIHTHFLLLTTLQHVLLCTELSKVGLHGLKEYTKNKSAYVYKRKVERGAKLVIVVPANTRTVFQMPRGNLETIQPRPLTLKIVGKYLDELKYHDAFDLMRKERINLNLIYDHNPEKFLKHIDEFLESIKNNSWLSLFLSDLENIDVTRTMYSSSYAAKIDANLNIQSNDKKIQEVCAAVRTFLNNRADIDSRVLPLITSYVKTNRRQDLEDSLNLIKTLKEKEMNGIKLPVGSDEALKYLLYMVDVNKLFDVALGMYDFNLVLLVANKSQKDPKEFLPMLNELNEMDENYKRYSINKHLKRFDEAIKYVVRCGPEKYEELKTFVKYHSLYTEALALFTPKDEIFKQISEDFGLHLKLKKQFTEAGIIYERGGNCDKAIECYKEATEWELAINLAQTWSKEHFQELCRDLVHSLSEEKRHKEALTILENFYEQKDVTIEYAVNNAQYKTAIRLCTQYGKHDYRDGPLLSAIIKEHVNLLDLVNTNFTTFSRHRERLCLVREIKKKNPIENYDPTFDNRDCDLYSDAGSTLASSSRGSSRSHRSSKNRRKHERKVASLKEGSQYEDVALVMALHTLVTSSFELRPLVKEVCIVLGFFGKDKEAFQLQTSLEKLLRVMKESLKEIWTHELVLEATNASLAAESAPEGAAVLPQGIASLAPHMKIAPVIHDLKWKLENLH